MAKEQINILHGKRSEARLNHSPDVEEERNFAGDGNQFDRGFVIGFWLSSAGLSVGEVASFALTIIRVDR